MGDAAWRIALPSGIDRATVLQRLREWPGVIDAVVTDAHALVRFVPGHPPDDPRPLIASAPKESLGGRPLHRLRVRYDGPDLEEVAAALSITRDELITRHAAREYTVELVGFQPGFAYLGRLDELLSHIPRRASPRPRVPALSVAIASGRTAVYPFASPGGWQLLGTALDVEPFSPERGALFALGDRVRFEPA